MFLSKAVLAALWAQGAVSEVNQGLPNIKVALDVVINMTSW
jgi:hypothetical protein